MLKSKHTRQFLRRPCFSFTRLCLTRRGDADDAWFDDDATHQQIHQTHKNQTSNKTPTQKDLNKYYLILYREMAGNFEAGYIVDYLTSTTEANIKLGKNNKPLKNSS